MKCDNAELRQMLAGNYVLGALQGAARARFETLMRRDPALRQLVQEWQQDLAPLAEETLAVAPPPRLLASIQRRIESGSEPKAGLWERLGFWRTFSAVGVAAALVLAVSTTFMTLRPPASLAPSYVAVLQDQEAHPALVVTAYNNPWRLQIEPVALASLPSDRVLQIWAVEKDSGVARPLIAFAPDNLRIALTEANWKLVKTARTLAVSAEIAGSNPSAPTTAVLYSGACINLKGV